MDEERIEAKTEAKKPLAVWLIFGMLIVSQVAIGVVAFKVAIESKEFTDTCNAHWENEIERVCPAATINVWVPYVPPQAIATDTILNLTGKG